MITQPSYTVMCTAARTFFDGERKASREAYAKVCIYIVRAGNRETHTIVLLTFVIPCLLSLTRRMGRTGYSETLNQINRDVRMFGKKNVDSYERLDIENATSSLWRKCDVNEFS